MKKSLKLYTVLTLLFVVLLSASSSFGGVFGRIVYYAAFAVLVLAALPLIETYTKEREAEAGVRETRKTLFSLSGKDAKLLLPVILPSVSIIFLISLTTSLLLLLIGASGSTVPDAPIFEMLLLHALIPAVLEEIMFRYLPLKLLSPYSPKWCVIYSALYFSLIHGSLYQIPYAFAAGVIFMGLDIAFDSVIPSILIHFVNNLLSVLWIKYCSSAISVMLFTMLLVSAVIVSFVFISRRKNEYIKMIDTVIKDKSTVETTYAPFALIIPMLIISVINLF